MAHLRAGLTGAARLRIFAAAARIKGKAYPVFRGPVRSVQLAAQSGSLSLDPASVVLVRLRPSVIFKPARSGRPVILQAWTGLAWVQVSSAYQDAAGHAAFSLTGLLPGTVSYRARALASRGAAAVDTQIHSVRYSSPPVVDPDPDPPVISTSSLPSGTAGSAYSGSLAVVGGRSGIWSFVGSSPAWLTLGSVSGVLGGTPPVAGQFPFTVQFKDSDKLVVTKPFTVTVVAAPPGAPVISTGALGDATSGVAYSAKVAVADGRAGTWSLVSAPAWASLSGSGTLSGTPGFAAVGTSSVTVKFSDTNGLSVTKILSLKVGQLPPVVATTALPGAVAGTAYSTTVTLTDGRAGSWSLSAAPAWLAVNASTGVLSGTPGAADTVSPPVTVRFTDLTAQVASRTLSLTVIPAAPTITTASLPDATTGSGYSARVVSGDGRAGTWALAPSPAPPAWLTLNASTGALGGTPAAADAGSGQVAVQFTDTHNRVVKRTFSLTTVRGAPNPVASFWLSVTTGSAHSCAVRSDRTAWCWGSNQYGQLGSSSASGSTAANPVPVQVGAATNWLSLSAGANHTCGVRADGTAWCWGTNDYGQLGTSVLAGKNVPQPAPQQVGTATNWSSITAGSNDTCGVRADGTAWCWGYNYYGQLGTSTNVGSFFPNSTPIQVGRTTNWSSLTTGNLHTCGVKADGTVWCWGYNYYGELGGTANIGFATANPTPLQVGTATNWSSVSAGTHHTCAVKADGSTWCWGWNYNGELGNATKNGIESQNPTPVQVGSATNWSAVSAAGLHSCGVRADGTAWCWGFNRYGESASTAGNGTDQPNPALSQVGTATNWSQVSSGGSHSCGVRADGTAWCWGSNQFGQLGSAGGVGSASAANPMPLAVTSP